VKEEPGATLGSRWCNHMSHFFMAGPERVRWELTALGSNGNGPFELVIDHAAGRITEHFDDAAQALRRQIDLKGFLVTARTSAVEPAPRRPAIRWYPGHDAVASGGGFVDRAGNA
jgi:hypothetical protein